MAINPRASLLLDSDEDVETEEGREMIGFIPRGRGGGLGDVPGCFSQRTKRR